MTEVWTQSDDGTSATVTGREKQPLTKKINPLWWFANDEEPEPYPGLYPNWPQWLRKTAWALRNPLQNFGKYVVGVYDRDYTVTGDAPVLATTWLDLPGTPRTGFKFSTVHVGWLRLPFVSYAGTHVLWYAGWQWWGFFGFKFNILHSKVQIV
jgi:hypothetical protein